MENTRTFPLNAWYVAAWSYEVGRRAAFGANCLQQAD